MTTAQDDGKVVSLTHRPPFPQVMLLILISVTGWVDPRATMRSEGLCQWKIPMTPSGNEPATFRFVAQHLNHSATAVPHIFIFYLQMPRSSPWHPYFKRSVYDSMQLSKLPCTTTFVLSTIQNHTRSTALHMMLLITQFPSLNYILTSSSLHAHQQPSHTHRVYVFFFLM